MRRLFIIIAIIAIAYPASAWSIAGIGFGGKLGYATYSGDILPSSGDVGGAVTYGAVLEISTLPVLDFEFHANYFAKDFSYTYDVVGVPVTTDFEFRDISLVAIAKKNVVPLPGSPLSLYVGGGLGWHVMNTEVATGALGDPSLADDPFSLISNTGKASVIGMLGVKIAPPVFPLALFGEARFGRIFTDEAINTTEMEAGVMLKF